MTFPGVGNGTRARLATGLLCLVRLGLSGVFIAAAIPKLAAPDLFAGNIFNYQMLPPWAVNAMALVLPWLELFIGVGLLLGIWTRACAGLMAVLMLVFTAAYISARARGLDIACGCFEVGAEAQKSSAAWVVLRDATLLGASLLLARFDRAPSPWSLWRDRQARAPVLEQDRGKARAGVRLR